MSYRTPGTVVPDGPEPLPMGPATKCEACGLSRIVTDTLYDGVTPYAYRPALEQPRACTPWARLKKMPYSFSWNPFASKCDREGSHVHNKCINCGHQWLTAFAEAT